jgi:hypothetical protein
MQESVALIDPRAAKATGETLLGQVPREFGGLGFDLLGKRGKLGREMWFNTGDRAQRSGAFP